MVQIQNLETTTVVAGINEEVLPSVSTTEGLSLSRE
jgi:hypothetical protein